MRTTGAINCILVALLGISLLLSAQGTADVIAGIIALTYGGGNILNILFDPFHMFSAG